MSRGRGSVAGTARRERAADGEASAGGAGRPADERAGAPTRLHRAGDVARVGAWLAAVAERSWVHRVDGEVFLLVTPLGLPWRRWLAAALEAAGVPVRRRLRLPAFAAVSTAVQAQGRDLASLRRAAAFEAAWLRRFPHGQGEAWALPAGAPHARAHALKPWLRRRLLERGVGVELGRLPWPAPGLHPFHLADPGEEEREARRLLAALGAP